jgi:hypothetical protein
MLQACMKSEILSDDIEKRRNAATLQTPDAGAALTAAGALAVNAAAAETAGATAAHAATPIGAAANTAQCAQRLCTKLSCLPLTAAILRADTRSVITHSTPCCVAFARARTCVCMLA